MSHIIECWQEVIRLQKTEEHFMVFGISMSACMDIHIIIGDKLYVSSKQIVLHFIDSKFIAWYCRWWHQNSISFFEGNLSMFTSSHPCKRCKFFTLSSCTKDKHSFIRHVVYLIIKLTKHTFGSIDIAKLLTDIYVIYHGSSWNEDNFIVCYCAIDDLDHPTDIRSKGSDKHSSFYCFDLSIHNLSNDFFWFCPTRSLCSKTISNI